MFGIFDLAFPKIVDPTIFVRKSFIFAEIFSRVARAPVAANCLAHRAALSSRKSTSPLGPGRQDPIEATVLGCTAASRSQGFHKEGFEVAKRGRCLIQTGDICSRSHVQPHSSISGSSNTSQVCSTMCSIHLRFIHDTTLLDSSCVAAAWTPSRNEVPIRWIPDWQTPILVVVPSYPRLICAW